MASSDKQITIEVLIETANSAESIKDIKKSLKDLKDTALEMGDQSSAEFIAVSQAAGKLKDKLGDVQKAFSDMSTGSKLEQLSNSLGGVGGALRNMDFAKAKEGAQRLAEMSKMLTFGDAIKGIKDMGSTFLTLGKALLTNPLFLIPALIVGLIAGIVALKDKVKFIGDAFAFFGDIINSVIDGIKEFLDWIGLTSFALDEQAAKTIENAKKVGAANEQKYNDEIALANAAGKDVSDLEIKKQEAAIETAKVQIEAIRTVAYAAGELTTDQITKLEELGKTIHDASLAIEVIKVKNETEGKAKSDKIAQDKTDKIKSDSEKRLKNEQDHNKQLIDEQLKYGITIKKWQEEQDRAIAIRLAKTEQEKLDLINKYLLEDVDAEQRAATQRFTTAVNIRKKEGKEFEDLAKINNNVNDYYAKKRIEIEAGHQDKLRIWLSEEEKLKKTAAEKELADKKAALKKEDDAVVDHNQSLVSHEEKTQGQFKDFWDRGYTEKSNLLNAQLNRDIDAADGNQQAIKDLYIKYGDDIEALSKERNARIQEDTISTINSIASSISTVLSAMGDYNSTVAAEAVKTSEDALNASISANDLAMQHELAVNGLTADEKKKIRKKYEDADYKLKLEAYNKETIIKKKAFDQDKKMKIAMAVISTITGAISAVTGMISAIPGPVGIILGVIAGLAVTAAGVLQIAKIKATTFDAGSAPTAPSIPEGTTAPEAGGGGGSFGPSQFGINSGASGVYAPSTFKSTTAPQPVQVYVTQTDIANQNKKVEVIQSRAQY